MLLVARRCTLLLGSRFCSDFSNEVQKEVSYFANAYFKVTKVSFGCNDRHLLVAFKIAFKYKLQSSSQMNLAFKGEISGVMSKTVQWDQTWDQA